MHALTLDEQQTLQKIGKQYARLYTWRGNPIKAHRRIGIERLAIEAKVTKAVYNGLLTCANTPKTQTPYLGPECSFDSRNYFGAAACAGIKRKRV